MDKAEAKMIAEKDLEFYRAMSYEEICSRIGKQESFERMSEKNEPYQVEFDFLFDDQDSGNIRVAGIVSFSWLTDFFPVSDDFIIAPDGKFVGE